jgi:hypothetical protein
MQYLPIDKIIEEATGLSTETDSIDDIIKALEELPDDFEIDLKKVQEAVKKQMDEAKGGDGDDAHVPDEELDDFEKGLLEDARAATVD